MKAVAQMQEASAKSFETCVAERLGQETQPRESSTCLADSADVLVARLLVEAKVLVQTEPDVIAVKTVAELLQVQEVLLESTCDGRLYAESGSARCGFSKILRGHTFPLALNPVNQMVTPFCSKRRARSRPSTEPVQIISV